MHAVWRSTMGAVLRPTASAAAVAGANKDTLAERLRRRPAKPMGSPGVGSNPTGVDLQHVGGVGLKNLLSGAHFNTLGPNLAIGSN